MTSFTNLVAEKMNGRTIERVAASKGSFDWSARTVTIFFTDGTQIEFYSTVPHEGNEEHCSVSNIEIEDDKTLAARVDRLRGIIKEKKEKYAIQPGTGGMKMKWNSIL